MKKILVLLVVISATHSNFAMQSADKRGGHASRPRRATAEEIRKSKPTSEQRAVFEQRRLTISEDVISANKKLVEGLAKEVREHQDLNAQTDKERFEELRELLHGVLQACGALEKRLDAMSERVIGVENKVTKLIESEVLVWPEEFNGDEAPAEKSRFPFANGSQWETGDAADKTGDQNG